MTHKQTAGKEVEQATNKPKVSKEMVKQLEQTTAKKLSKPSTTTKDGKD